MSVWLLIDCTSRSNRKRKSNDSKKGTELKRGRNGTLGITARAGMTNYLLTYLERETSILGELKDIKLGRTE